MWTVWTSGHMELWGHMLWLGLQFCSSRSSPVGYLDVLRLCINWSCIVFLLQVFYGPPFYAWILSVGRLKILVNGYLFYHLKTQNHHHENLNSIYYTLLHRVIHYQRQTMWPPSPTNKSTKQQTSAGRRPMTLPVKASKNHSHTCNIAIAHLVFAEDRSLLNIVLYMTTWPMVPYTAVVSTYALTIPCDRMFTQSTWIYTMLFCSWPWI
jgi:hypothetical protein